MLRITLHINTQPIGDWEVRNVTPNPADAIHRYEVRPITDQGTPERPTVTVLHRRANGAKKLTAAVMRALAALDTQEAP